MTAPQPDRRWAWRSPIRGPWLTSVLGLVLLVGIPIEFLTGLISYAAYNPLLAGNDTTPHHGVLGFYLFDWLTRPSWIYRASQGIHVILGLALVPVVLAKLWSVIPKLFTWPPLHSVAHFLERLSLALLVGGIVFQLVTGILNIDYDYSFKFSFYDGHFLGAWLFVAGFAVHVALKFPEMVRALRSRSLRAELATGVAATVPEPALAHLALSEGTYGPGTLVAAHPAPPTMSRRGVLALVAGSSAAVVALTAGQTFDGVPRRVALLSPRSQSYGSGPDDFQVNRTAAAAGVQAAALDTAWRLELVGADPTRPVTFDREELLALPLVTAILPIACVEGWSTTQTWTGVRLAELARLAGANRVASAVVVSLEPHGAFARAALSGSQVEAGHAMLALRVNGADLSLDHGFPARVIVPAAPGVYNTKWVRRITFETHETHGAREARP